MDTRDTAFDFAALAALLPKARADRALAHGDTPAGRRSLAAGLLLRAVFGERAHFASDAFGKPRLTGGQAFNLSHAGDYAVLAAGESRIGVDIERMRALDALKIARRFFHPDEYAYLSAQADPLPAFFDVWTLKESYIKAEGRGFAIAPTAYCILPSGESGAVFSGDAPYHFRRYAGAPDGYRLSVCATEDAFDGEIVICRAAQMR